jgi:hypothetical protein
MRGTSGSEHVTLKVGSTQIGSWTLGTGFNTYQASTTASGGITVNFDNDASGRDVQVDCIWLPNGQFQAESQSYNTGVWNGSGCGGSNSEWLHCNGTIGFSAYKSTMSPDVTSANESLNNSVVYPNPVANNLVLDLTADADQVIIYSINGQQVKSLIPASRHVEINVVDLKPGEYVVKAISQKETWTQKILKK